MISCQFWEELLAFGKLSDTERMYFVFISDAVSFSRNFLVDDIVAICVALEDSVQDINVISTWKWQSKQFTELTLSHNRFSPNIFTICSANKHPKTRAFWLIEFSTPFIDFVIILCRRTIHKRLGPLFHHLKATVFWRNIGMKKSSVKLNDYLLPFWALVFLWLGLFRSAKFIAMESVIFYWFIGMCHINWLRLLLSLFSSSSSFSFFHRSLSLSLYLSIYLGPLLPYLSTVFIWVTG